jgi:hypothetical protein
LAVTHAPIHPNERERKNRRVETLHPTKINPKLQRQEKEEENKMCRETKETPNDRRRSKSFVYLIYKYRERERERERDLLMMMVCRYTNFCYQRELKGIFLSVPI